MPNIGHTVGYGATIVFKLSGTAQQPQRTWAIRRCLGNVRARRRRLHRP